jgi:hypothetical protein
MTHPALGCRLRGFRPALSYGVAGSSHLGSDAGDKVPGTLGNTRNSWSTPRTPRIRVSSGEAAATRSSPPLAVARLCAASRARAPEASQNTVRDISTTTTGLTRQAVRSAARSSATLVTSISAAQTTTTADQHSADVVSRDIDQSGEAGSDPELSLRRAALAIPTTPASRGSSSTRPADPEHVVTSVPPQTSGGQPGVCSSTLLRMTLRCFSFHHASLR